MEGPILMKMYNIKIKPDLRLCTKNMFADLPGRKAKFCQEASRNDNRDMNTAILAGGEFFINQSPEK